MAQNKLQPDAPTQRPQIGTPVNVRLQPEMLARIDMMRRREPDLPTRSEAVRRLVGLGITAWESAGRTPILPAEAGENGKRGEQ